MSTSAVTLARLAEIAGANVVRGGATAETLRIEEIGLSSSDLKPGALFAALPGTRVHGANYAFDSPASAILTDPEGAAIIRKTDERRPVLVVENVRSILGRVSAEVYGHPSRSLTLLGVTGTSGKTTTSFLLEKGLMHAGLSVGLIGTTGTRINGRAIPSELTTPEAPMLQSLFRQMVDEGVTHVVMEVSSHALELGRVNSADFNVAGFTNLSQDHLDFHSTMEDYFEAKAAFFDPTSPIRAAKAVVCVDEDWGKKMAQRAGDSVTVATGEDAVADVTGAHLSSDDTGAQQVRVTTRGETFEFVLPLPGEFNVANATLAIAMAQAVGIDGRHFVQGLEKVSVPGRMERVDEGQSFVAVVDYAHKPAAVAAVLKTLRSQVDGRIGVVVGCGGDRDASKRPIMGAEAARAADLVIVTDDNPRSEDPASIRAAVVEGAREAAPEGCEIRERAQRGEAIDELIAWAQPGDAVAVVGKGHEVGQIVGDTVLDFDDREEVRRALRALRDDVTSTTTAQ